MFTIIILAIAILCFSGCSSVGTYFQDRALDLVDCFKVKAQFCALEAHFKFTDAFFTGVGFGFEAKTYGFDGRHVGSGSFEFAGMPCGYCLTFTPHGSNLEMNDFTRTLWLFVLFKNSAMENYPQETEKIWSALIFTTSVNKGENNLGQFKNLINAFEIEAGCTVYIGLTLGFSSGEFADFLLGWFGIDIADDDTKTK